TKPYSSRELLARVRAVLRRNVETEEIDDESVLEAGGVRIDVERHVVSVRGEELSMPLKEFELLEILVRNSGRVMTRGQLIDRIWGEDYVGDTKTLDVHVKRLRRRSRSIPRSRDCSPRCAVSATSSRPDPRLIRRPGRGSTRSPAGPGTVLNAE